MRARDRRRQIVRHRAGPTPWTSGGSERECDQNGDACAVEHELVGEVEASLKELSIKDVVAYVPVERGERRAAKEQEEAPGKHCV